MGCGASAAAPTPPGTNEYQGGGGGGGGGGRSTQSASSGKAAPVQYEMDDEVAQQTAELLFDLLPYYDTGNREADQIFLATLQAQSMLVHARDPHGNTLLMVACQSVKTDLVELMISKEVDVNAQNYMGVSALHIVCYEVNDKSYGMCEKLINAGAATDAKDAEGCTPVHYAASGGHASLVALLLMYGANAVAVDNMGYTAQDYAVQSNHTEVVQLLYHAAGAEDTSETAEEQHLIEAAEEFWTEYLDPASGCPYYYNSLSGETTWDRPESFVSTLADAAADALRITQQENVAKAEEEYASRADGELQIPYLLERWRRIAWRAGMKGVMEKQRKATKKFAMEQAKARMYLLQNGTADQQNSIQKELKMNQQEIDNLKAKLAQTEAQKAVKVDNSEIERLKAELAKKNQQLGGMNMDAMKQSMRKEVEDEFESAKQKAIKEVEARHAEKADKLAKELAQRDENLGSMKERLEKAEKASLAKKMSADEAAKRQEELAMEARRSDQKVQEMMAKLEEKEKALAVKAKELDTMRATASSKESAAEARAKKLAEEKSKLEMEKQKMSLELANLKDENAKLRRDYLHEQNLRRKYHNEIEDLKGAIRVYSRTRPLSQSEKDKNCTEVTAFPDEFTITCRDDDKGTNKKYEFDKCFGPQSTQEEVFDDTKRLIQSAIDGYNVCIFAYGQTGSGKTFTMMGASNDENPGLTPRAVKEIFRIARRDKEKISVKVKFYMVELYRDNLVDLLSSKAPTEQGNLNIKKDARGVVYIEGVTQRECSDKNMLNEAIADGMSRRKTASTAMNSESSRSHLVMSILVEVTNLASNVATVGKLSLVDLAGSERVGKTGATADRLKEAQSINKSLSALGDVIGALTSGEKHIPYRNHKLTMLLSDSLGGNAKTLMFVNASPADYNVAETNNSLTFAQRVKKVVNNSTKTVETAEIKALKNQLMMLKATLSMKK